MKIALFGSIKDHSDFKATVLELPKEVLPYHELFSTEEYDDLRSQLADKQCDLIVVMANGAGGMEACMGAKKMCPETPIFWFSNDRDFGPQSYRIGCTYFSTKPITPVGLQKAFARLAI